MTPSSGWRRQPSVPITGRGPKSLAALSKSLTPDRTISPLILLLASLSRSDTWSKWGWVRKRRSGAVTPASIIRSTTGAPASMRMWAPGAPPASPAGITIEVAVCPLRRRFAPTPSSRPKGPPVPQVQTSIFKPPPQILPLPFYSLRSPPPGFLGSPLTIWVLEI